MVRKKQTFYSKWSPVRKALSTLVLLLVIVQPSIAPAQTQEQDDVMAVKARFSFDQSGNFAGTVFHALGQKEVGVLIAAGCAAYGADCTKEAAALVEIAQRIDANVSGSGNERHGIYRAPVGWTICRAKWDYAHAGISGGASMSAQLMRTNTDNGLGWYANVPRGNGHGEGIDVDLYIEYVRARPGNEAMHQCWAPALLWDCKGHEKSGCNTFDGRARYP